MSTRGFGSLAIVIILVGGCEKSPPNSTTSGPASRPVTSVDANAPENILIITLDTTRADRIGCYGNKSAKTPCMDNLAQGGVRFTKAYCSAPLTLPSHASFFTGAHPPVHGCRVNAAEALGTTIPLMPAWMKDRGYSTAAFVSAFVLNKRFGLSRGFDSYDDGLNVGETADATSHGERRGDLTTDAAMSWFKQNGTRRFFVWVHLFDPHTPYAAPAPYGGQGDAYDGEIAFADAQIDRLMKWLADAGKLEDTLVVVAGDHGESLGEHDEPTHGVLLHDATLHVPLIMRWQKRMPKGRVVESPVELVDVFPTMVDFVGGGPIESANGHSLRSLWDGESADANRLTYSESEYTWRSYGWSPLKSVTRGQWRYVEAPLREIYDHEVDPGETKNLIDQKLELADELREMLVEMTSGFKPFETAKVSADAGSRGMLESLGYVGAAAGNAAPTGPLKNPKSMMGTYSRYMNAQGLLDRGQLPEALQLLESVVKETPESDELYVSLGRLYLLLGRASDGEQAMVKSLRKNASDPFKLWVLGESLRRQQKYDKAIECFKKSIELMPEMAEAHRGIATIQMIRRDYEAAYEPCKKFTELSPASAVGWTNLANTCLMLRRLDEALRASEKAISLDSKFLAAYQANSQILLLMRRKADAIASMRRAISEIPEAAEMKTPLVWMIGTTAGIDAQTLAEGVRLGEEQAAKLPNDARTLDALGAVFAANGRFDEAVVAARKAAELAAASGDAALADKIGQRIRAYEAKQPMRSE